MHTRLFIASGFAALYAAAGIIGSILQSVFGVPGIAGVIMVFLGPFLVVFTLNTFKKFGGTFFMCLIYSIIVIPFNVLGTPGFFPKIVIGIISGLIVELLFLLPLRKYFIWNAFIGGVYELVVGYSIVLLGILFRMPGINELAKISLMWYFIIPAFIISSISGYLGLRIYKNMEGTPLMTKVHDRMSGR